MERVVCMCGAGVERGAGVGGGSVVGAERVAGVGGGVGEVGAGWLNSFLVEFRRS